MAVNWIEFPTFKVTHGPFEQRWRLAVETVEGVNHLKFHAAGEWKLGDVVQTSCGPDGYPGAPLTADSLILADANIGCLIGRFGGSSASRAVVPIDPAAEPAKGVTPGNMFPIGSDCMFAIPEGLYGPLFVGFNWAARPIEITSLELKIAGATF